LAGEADERCGASSHTSGVVSCGSSAHWFSSEFATRSSLQKRLARQDARKVAESSASPQAKASGAITQPRRAFAPNRAWSRSSEMVRFRFLFTIRLSSSPAPLGWRPTPSPAAVPGVGRSAD